MKPLSVPEKHQLRIAKDTLRLSDAGARIMGGPTKEESREILKRAGWSDARIAKWEGPPESDTGLFCGVMATRNLFSAEQESLDAILPK
jgi:hypothetical protein